MNDFNNWQEKFIPCEYSKKLINKLAKMNSQVAKPVDIKEITKAIYYAKKYHGRQMRQSGEPYYSHPVEVAYMFANHTAIEIPKYFRTDLIVTALLHDTIEDTKLTYDMIIDIFGKIVANQVDDLTRIKIDRKISAGESVNSLFTQHKKDVLHIKLFDRFHNILTIGCMSPKKIIKIIDETLNYFVPLTIYLESEKLVAELSKLCTAALVNAKLIDSYFHEDSSLLTDLGFENDLAQMQNQ